MPETLFFREARMSDNNEPKEISHSEIRRSPFELNKITETSSQEVSEDTYSRTIEHISGEFRDIMPESQLVRIDIESENYKPTVLSSEMYADRFPEVDPGVLGHYDSEGRIYLKDGKPEVINHVTTHEALHLTSYTELNDSVSGREVYRSGIREVVYDENRMTENKNQALNEGITELYAIREMRRRGEISSIESITAYPEAQEKAFELRKIVGNDIMEEAYFGGKRELLESEVNRLSYGDETAWERYSRNVDILEYGTDADEIRNARRELTIQNAIMLSCKGLET